MAVKPKRIWDNFELVGEVQKSAGIKYQFSAACRDGIRYINIREFYLRKKDNEWCPGRDGITIPLVMPVEEGAVFLTPFQEFNKILQDAAAIANDMALSNEAKAVYAYPKEA